MLPLQPLCVALDHLLMHLCLELLCVPVLLVVHSLSVSDAAVLTVLNGLKTCCWSCCLACCMCHTHGHFPVCSSVMCVVGGVSQHVALHDGLDDGL